MFSGKEKQYYRRSLEKGVWSYFAAISRERVVTERVPTGRLDGYGHMIYEDIPVRNLLGEDVKVRELAVRPSIQALCDHLRIRPATWQHLRKSAETADICLDAEEMIKDWAVGELVTREGKNVRGVMHYLDNSFGWKDSREISVSSETVKGLAGLSLAEKLQVIAEAATDDTAGD